MAIQVPLNAENRRPCIQYLRRVLLIALALPGGLWAQPEPMRVTTQALSDISIVTSGRAPATVKARNESLVAAQITGKIEHVAVDVGDGVSQGQTLVTIDPVDFELQLEQRLATLASIDARIMQAKERLERAQDLSANRFASADELLARQTDLSVLQADRKAQEVLVATARRELEKTVIKAPFDGAVVERQAQRGAFATLGAPLMTVVDLQRPELDVDLNPRDAESIGAAVELFFDSQGQQWPVQLARLSSVIGSASRTRKARLTFVDSQAPIGASGTLIWYRSALALPPSFLVQRDGQLGVFVAEAGRARFVPLPQAQEGRPTVVELPATTALVVEGRDRVRDGQAISID